MRWYVGVPQSGKTTLALAHAAELHRATGFPLVVFDSAEVRQLAGVPRVESVDAAVQALWRDRRSCSFVPRELRDVDRMCAAIRGGKEVIALVDEAHVWLSAHDGASSELVAIMRATQHARCHLLLTTQHLTGDIPQAALSCAPTLYVFRSTSSAVLKTLERTYGIPPAIAGTLAQYQFCRQRTGF